MNLAEQAVLALAWVCVLVLTAGSPEAVGDHGPAPGADATRSDTSLALISGRVLTSDGRPVDSASFLLSRTKTGRGRPPAESGRVPDSLNPTARTATDSSGRFSLEGVPAAELEVRLVSPWGEGWWFGLEPTGTSHLYLEIVLPPEGRPGVWPLSVNVYRRPAALHGSGFYRRRAERKGYFAGPKELQKALGDGRYGEILTMAREKARTPACTEPVVYVDGQLLLGGHPGLDRKKVVAVEAYRPNDSPPEAFESSPDQNAVELPSDCGVVVLWTTRDTAPEQQRRRRHRSALR